MSLKLMSLVALAFVTMVAVLPSARAETPPFVFPDFCCYYNGSVVRTVTPPAAFPNEGRDNFYVVKSQPIIGIVGVAPGAIGYHGGHWKFHLVTWTVTPYPLTSEAAILGAAAAGDVTIARIPANDFLCPIQF
ncbi:MAG: hypothetical protein E6H05_13095 [Bacillati bacterium ANGP1]|uniref:Uncharacterized protein n=1 Tax=Candidatus Segetimicrobium genomatis TaxID=2569760 RepID=A0A537IJ45_9BACT|nr:MAG: hypothetical protein E6H05_13095 [Terrabacteria group bacterium ANGP1]